MIQVTIRYSEVKVGGYTASTRMHAFECPADEVRDRVYGFENWLDRKYLSANSLTITDENGQPVSVDIPRQYRAPGLIQAVDWNVWQNRTLAAQ